MSLKDKVIGALIFACTFFFSGMAFQEYMSQPSGDVIAATAQKPERRHSPSHVTLARDGVVKADDQKPSKPVPKGSVVLHTAKVAIGPSKSTINGQTTFNRGVTGEYGVKATEGPCPPIDLDLTVYRDKDGGTRFDVLAPDGEILGGVHTPSVESLPAMRKRNGIGPAVIYDGVETKPGVMFKREVLVVDVVLLGAQDFASLGALYRF